MLLGADQSAEVAAVHVVTDVDPHAAVDAVRRVAVAGTLAHSASRSGIAVGSRVHAIGIAVGTVSALRPNVTVAGDGTGAVRSTVRHAHPGAARSVDRFAAQLVRSTAQLHRERPELAHLGLGGSDLAGDQLVEAALHRPAMLPVPDGDDVGDLLQRAAELLGPGEERQPAQRPSS